MDLVAQQSSEVLLARVNRELEYISDTQHRLARRRLVLQEQATRLRLGASPFEVSLTLRAAAMDEDERNRLASDWAADLSPTEGDESRGGSRL